jgi:hypothetical protein
MRWRKEMTQTKRTKGDGGAEAKRLVDLVQREIDDGATSVEEIHKAIANLPLDILDRLDVLETRRGRELHVVATERATARRKTSTVFMVGRASARGRNLLRTRVKLASWPRRMCGVLRYASG